MFKVFLISSILISLHICWYLVLSSISFICTSSKLWNTSTFNPNITTTCSAAKIPCMHYANVTKKWNTCKCTRIIPYVWLHTRFVNVTTWIAPCSDSFKFYDRACFLWEDSSEGVLKHMEIRLYGSSQIIYRNGTFTCCTLGHNCVCGVCLCFWSCDTVTSVISMEHRCRTETAQLENWVVYFLWLDDVEFWVAILDSRWPSWINVVCRKFCLVPSYSAHQILQVCVFS